MQLLIGLLAAAGTLGAAAIFVLGVATFRLRRAARSKQFRAAVTMWAGVLAVCGSLCLAGIMLTPPL
ncbi:MAG TPA: hypothetical protein VGO26_02580 [Amnibacterium sp.]|jgi:hypothetical protein|nr:hypothetical protein [Amnibacterium sp.]